MEANMQNEMFEQWQQVRNELERSRKEASEGRQKAEKELFEASKMVWCLLSPYPSHHEEFMLNLLILVPLGLKIRRILKDAQMC